MKILILGGTRFFGLETAQRLFASGHNVAVFSRRVACPLLPAGIRRLVGNRADERAMAALGEERWDAVIDNICYSPADALLAVKTFRGRVGTYVFTSSAAVYLLLDSAIAPFSERMTELLPLKKGLPDSPVYPYSARKLEAEKVFLTAFEETGFPAVILRPPDILGPRDHTLRACSYWYRIADGGPLLLPYPEAAASYMFSPDMARVFEAVFSARKPGGRVFNIAGVERLSLKDFAGFSAAVMKRRVRAASPPEQWLLANGFDLSSSPFSDPLDFTLDISAAAGSLKWSSTPCLKMLEESIAWFSGAYPGTAPANYGGRHAELDLANKWFQASPHNCYYLP